VKASNGRIIADFSEGYKKEQECLGNISRKTRSMHQLRRIKERD
jgi:uncharacterized protein YegP (UPF0339 family)